MKEVKIYETEDYEAVKKMPLSEVIEMLDWIDDGWIGSSGYYGQESFEGDENDYDKFRLHTALKIAIKKLKEGDGEC